jgi:hypothetical protein
MGAVLLSGADGTEEQMGSRGQAKERSARCAAAEPRPAWPGAYSQSGLWSRAHNAQALQAAARGGGAMVGSAASTN